MPIVQRAESDYFRLGPLVDFMVNPANTYGAAGAGLSKEFRDRHPGFYEQYRSYCATGKFKIGKMFTFKDRKTMSYSILTVATKDHWMDTSREEYVRKALLALREYLQSNNGARSLHTMAMPLLGCGLGQLPVDLVLPLMYEYLDDLDNVIHLSRRVEDIGHVPKYLAIIGPRRLRAKTDCSHLQGWEIEDDRRYVEQHVNEALKIWGLTWSDFDAVVSGGADGVDAIGCGLDRKHISYEMSLTKKYHPKLPIVCKADWDRYGRSAGMIRNRTVMDIATHVVAIFKPGVMSIGTPMALKLATEMNRHQKDPDKTKQILALGDPKYDQFCTPLHVRYEKRRPAAVESAPF